MARLVRPLRDFISTEAAGGALLLAAALCALAWANIPGGGYGDFWDTRADLQLGVVEFDATIRGWVNDGLMAVFFFVVGLEIKRELLVGELASKKVAALPVAAAAGGMALPAAIYAALNASGTGARGWGIPMATDIAFSLGVMALLAGRVPLSLKIFLLALAIVDDLGAIAVIAVFYSDDIAIGWLAVSVALLAFTVTAWRAGLRSRFALAALAFAVWFAMHESGVHATIAGVALGLLAPIAPEAGGGEALLPRLERLLHPWTSLAIVPLFALANAGVDFGGGALRDAVSSPITLGIVIGLAAGKPAGILLFSWLAVRARLAALPDSVGWRQIAAAGALAGIGFTVSLFIANLAFTNQRLVDEAKIGIVAASALMAVAGYVALRAAAPALEQAGHEDAGE